MGRPAPAAGLPAGRRLDLLLRDLADLALVGHHYDEGERLARQAVDVRATNRMTGRQIDVAADFLVLGLLLIAQGRHAEARKPLALASCLRPEREDYSKYLGQARRRAA